VKEYLGGIDDKRTGTSYENQSSCRYVDLSAGINIWNRLGGKGKGRFHPTTGHEGSEGE
jgi:hypothetical protein